MMIFKYYEQILEKKEMEKSPSEETLLMEIFFTIQMLNPA